MLLFRINSVDKTVNTPYFWKLSIYAKTTAH